MAKKKTNKKLTQLAVANIKRRNTGIRFNKSNSGITKYAYGGGVYDSLSNYNAYNSASQYGNYGISGGGVSFESTAAGGYSSQVPYQNNGLNSNVNNNSGLYSAGLNIAQQGISASDDNQYNQVYGTSGTSAEGQSAASLGGPVASVGASALGVIGTGLDQLTNSQDYNEYGVNQSDNGSAIEKGDAYSQAMAGFDQMGELTKNAESGNWDNVVIDLLGGAQFTGQKNYNEEQDAAKKREAEANKLERQRKRSLMEHTPSVTYQPTLTYAMGGQVPDSTGRNIIKTYGDLNNNWMKDTTMQYGDLQRYGQPTYVQYNNTPGASSGGRDVIGSTSFSQDSTTGPKATFYRDYTNKATGESYQVPTFDSDVYDKYFPEAKTVYANGGQVNEANAELETDEVFRTPDGSIEEVPDGTPSHAKGGVKMELPEGTEILGKMEGKYNDSTYKEMGQDIKKRYDKYSKLLDKSTTSLGTKTSQLMLDKVQKEFDDLWSDQEFQKSYNKYAGYTQEQTNASVAKFDPMQSDQQGNLSVSDIDYTEPQYANGGLTQEPENYTPKVNKYGLTENYYKDWLDDYDYGKSNYSTYDNPYYGESSNKQGLADMTGTIDRNNTKSSELQNSQQQGWWNKNKGNIGTGIGMAAQFAPAAYNMYQGMFGSVDELNYGDYRNPYRGKVLGQLEDSRYNINPELEANELSYQTARSNMRKVSPGTGALLSNYNALAGSRMRADAGAYARKQNMENQSKLQKASILGQMGSQEAQMRLNVDTVNQQSNAAKQQFVSTGLDQLAGSAANLFQENNKKQSDAGLYSILDKYASAYDLGELTDNQYKQIQKILSKKGK